MTSAFWIGYFFFCFHIFLRVFYVSFFDYSHRFKKLFFMRCMNIFGIRWWNSGTLNPKALDSTILCWNQRPAGLFKCFEERIRTFNGLFRLAKRCTIGYKCVIFIWMSVACFSVFFLQSIYQLKVNIAHLFFVLNWEKNRMNSENEKKIRFLNYVI